MLKLNQRKYNDDKREFEYELPSFLAKDGKCFLKIRIKPFSKSAEAIRQAGERIVHDSKVKIALIRKWREDRLRTVKDQSDIEDPRLVSIYEELSEKEDAASAKAQRDAAMAYYDACVEEWSSNIWNADDNAIVKPTREMFEQLVLFAFPEDGMTRYGELADALTQMLEDISNLARTDDQAAAEVAGDDEKN